MNEEEKFKEYSHFCLLSRKKNTFDKVKTKINQTKGGAISVTFRCSGFSSESHAKMFAGILEDLMSNKEGYGIDYRAWGYKKDREEKNFKIVPLEYWRKHNDIADYARDFVELPSDIGFSFINGSTIEYDGPYIQAIEILNNLGFETI